MQDATPFKFLFLTAVEARNLKNVQVLIRGLGVLFFGGSSIGVVVDLPTRRVRKYAVLQSTW